MKNISEILENGIDTENPFLTAFRQYQNIDKLTRDILIELVDHIILTLKSITASTNS